MMPAQPVDATPSDINLFSKGGVYGASETGEAFRSAEERPSRLRARKIALERLFEGRTDPPDL